MEAQNLKITNTPIILSRGIFDLLKEEIRRKKLSRFNEQKLELELRSAVQVLRSELPENVVAVDTKVKVENVDTKEVFEYNLVAPAKARRKNKTLSILTPIGVGLVGYTAGSLVQWELPNGVGVFKIIEVEQLNGWKKNKKEITESKNTIH